LAMPIGDFGSPNARGRESRNGRVSDVRSLLAAVGYAFTVRVQLLSDLDVEYDDDGGEAFARSVEVAGDVLVLAGDILPLLSPDRVRSALGWFCARFAHVVFVPGN